MTSARVRASLPPLRRVVARTCRGAPWWRRRSTRFTITPPPARTIASAARRAHRNCPFRLTSRTRVPRRLVRLEEVTDGWARQRRVVDEDVDGAEAFEHTVEERVDHRRPTRHRRGSPPRRRSPPRCRARPPRHRRVATRAPSAPSRSAIARPMLRARAGDDGDAAFEASVRVLRSHHDLRQSFGRSSTSISTGAWSERSLPSSLRRSSGQTRTLVAIARRSRNWSIPVPGLVPARLARRVDQLLDRRRALGEDVEVAADDQASPRARSSGSRS